MNHFGLILVQILIFQITQVFISLRTSAVFRNLFKGALVVNQRKEYSRTLDLLC